MKQIKKIIVKLNLINILSVFFYIFRIFPIKNNKIIIVNFHGKGYGDSAKYIVEQLNKENIEIYWALTNMKEKLPDHIKKVKFNSLSYFYHLVTSRVWLNNSRFPQFVRKRKKQYYIQIWHGCLALKKIEFDAYEKMTEYYKKWMVRDTKMTNLMISNSKFCDDLYRRAFHYNGEIIRVGCPRNDILVKENHRINDKVRKYYGIDEKEKILLYAPTFRNDFSNNPYDIDFIKIKEELEEKYNSKWRILIRLHPIIKKTNALIKNNQIFINATDYPDIQELIISCDLLITDYSSTMFEAMIAKKNVILYTKDLKEYNNERGTYFKINDLPFENAQSNKELLKVIKQIDSTCFRERYNIFCKKIGLNETGIASQAVAKRIISVIKGEKYE